MPRARRCSLRACARQGIGDPPLCAEHTKLFYRDTPKDPEDDPIGAVVDRLMNHPKAQEVLGNVSGHVDWFAAMLDNVLKGGPLPKFHGVRERQPSPGGQPPPPRQPPPRPPVDEYAAARKVMGFKPADQLTPDVIKTRYRVLAKQNHPDKTGGDDSRMKAINAARDVLLRGMG